MNSRRDITSSAGHDLDIQTRLATSSAVGHSEEAVPSSRQNFCEYLTAARHERNMSIDEIAGVTRIPVRSLEYLEAGLFEKLPADVFVRGFLRSYARCVGLDEEEAIRRYTRCGMTPAPVSSPLAEELASSMATIEEREYSGAVRRVTSTFEPLRQGTSPSIETDHGNERDLIENLDGEASEARQTLLPDTLAMSPVSLDVLLVETVGEETLVRGTDQSSQNVSLAVPVDASVSAQRETDSTQDSYAQMPGKRRKRRRKRKSRLATESYPSKIQAEGGNSDGDLEKVRVEARAVSVYPDRADVLRADEQPALTALLPSMPQTAPLSKKSGNLPGNDVVAVDAMLTDADECAGTQARTSEGTDCGDESTGSSSARRSNLRKALQGQESERTSVSPRPVLVIDDDRPEDAERIQQERAERADGSWRTFLPPALLDSDEGSHRGALTLAVIILVIVATLTMSYLLRRPSGSGDGITQEMVVPPPGNTLVARV